CQHQPRPFKLYRYTLVISVLVTSSSYVTSNVIKYNHDHRDQHSFPTRRSSDLMSVIGVITHLDRNAKGNGATSPDAVVEAFRGLRLSLVNEYDPASGPIVVTVTSPGSGDGKSFVSSNLALAFSYAKQRTLLVDA